MNCDNLKITVFGDSIGKGIVTDSGKLEVLSKNAVSLFERELGVKVDNRSIYGQSLKRIYERGLIDTYLNNVDTSARNVVVIELGGNDADFNWREVASNPKYDHDSKTSLKEFTAYYGEIIKKLKDNGVRVIACTIAPIDSERFFNNVIGTLTDKERVLEFFKGDFNTIHRHQETFNNEILKNSYKYDVDVIDLRQKFLISNEFEHLMCLDGIHPNECGHTQIYSAVGEFLANNSLIA
ncbi:MAG: SGNH/GDSL hydrolase family protein [Clostridiales bacterium]|nr:SGNH/GDSL hydrolase family protein [Clostridiales bacterium]